MFASNNFPTFKMKNGPVQLPPPEIRAPVVKATPVSLIPDEDMLTKSGEGNGGIFSGSIWWRAILVILLLSFLGFNMFEYLGDATQEISDFFKPIVQSFAGLVAYITGDAIKLGADVTAGAAKTGIDIAAGATKSGIDVAQGATESTVTTLQRGLLSGDSYDSTLPAPPTNTTSHAIGPISISEVLDRAVRNPSLPAPSPDDSTSVTQKQQTGKSGYCYIGEDRGFRSCIAVESSDKCLSGDIFPTKDVCIHPNLRA